MSQPSANSLATLNGNFKVVYASKERDLIPEGVKLLNKIPFAQKEKIGSSYNEMIVLGMEHGMTWGGPDEDAFNLRAAVAGQSKEATIKGNPKLLRSVLGMTAASRASNGNQAAFVDAVNYLVKAMMKSFTRKLEIEVLYGNEGYGLISAVDGTNTQITIKESEWAAGIFVGAEKMPIEIRSFDNTISRGIAEVSTIALDTRVLTLSGPIVGIVTTASSEDRVYHQGAYGKEFKGIHSILTQSSGDLFGITVSSYNLFRGNSYAVGGAISFTKLNEAIAQAVFKGLDGKVLVLLNPKSWAKLLSDQAALRMYDSSYSSAKLVNGGSALEFHSQNGVMEIEPSIFVKQGYAYILQLDSWKRVGSSDVTFKRPGYDDQFFRESENITGYELRLWCDQALFTDAPGLNVVMTGITY